MIDHAERMRFTRKIGLMSPDPSTKVGCTIWDEHNTMIAAACNDFPEGMDYGRDGWRLNNREEKYRRVVHAEVRAVMRALSFETLSVEMAPLTYSTHGMHLYCTLMPCEPCALLIVEARIKFVYAPRLDLESDRAKRLPYERTMDYFTECGVEFIEVEP